MRPDILPEKVANEPGVAAFLQALDLAVNAIDVRGGWPATSQPSRIEVVKGAGIATNWGPVVSPGRAKLFVVDPQRPPTILVGLDLLAQGAGAALAQLAPLPAADLLALLLAHEAFHLGEADRMIACGVSATDRLSNFALGLDPRFSDPWQAAGRALAANYPTRRGADPDMQPAFSGTAWKSSDLASELIADALSLRMLRDHPQAAAMSQALLALRAKEEAAALASFMGAPRQADPPYQIGAALASLLPLTLQAEDWPIWQRSWELALAEIQAEPDLNEGAREAIARAMPLAPRPAPTFWSRFKKK